MPYRPAQPTGPFALTRTLAWLRLCAIAGQSVAVLVCAWWMQLGIPLLPLLLGIGLLAVFAVFAAWRLGQPWPVREWEAIGHIAADTLVLGYLLYFTGGASNPFITLLLVPIALSAAALSVRAILAVATLAGFAYLILLWRHVPLPMPMHAKARPRSVQSAITTSSTGRPSRAPSMPRPDFRLIESSPLSMWQPSMRTRLHESTSMPSRRPVMVRFLISTSEQNVGCVAQLLPGWRTVKPSQRTSRQCIASSTGVPRGGLLLAAVVACCGPLQLIPALRRRAPWFHRWNGRIYVTVSMLVGLAGLAMLAGGRSFVGASQNGNVGINGILLVICAALAWHRARKRDFAAHRRWALRLFVLAAGVWLFRIGMAAWIARTASCEPFHPMAMQSSDTRAIGWRGTSMHGRPTVRMIRASSAGACVAGSAPRSSSSRSCQVPMCASAPATSPSAACHAACGAPCSRAQCRNGCACAFASAAVSRVLARIASSSSGEL